jgi:hypothetical protein
MILKDRTGSTRDPVKALNLRAITNLNLYFGDLPEVFAVGRPLGVTSQPPAGAPLLLEGLQSATEYKNKKMLPLSADFLLQWILYLEEVTLDEVQKPSRLECVS